MMFVGFDRAHRAGCILVIGLSSRSKAVASRTLSSCCQAVAPLYPYSSVFVFDKMRQNALRICRHEVNNLFINSGNSLATAEKYLEWDCLTQYVGNYLPRN
jgi:hypothetical protein